MSILLTTWDHQPLAQPLLPTCLLYAQPCGLVCACVRPGLLCSPRFPACLLCTQAGHRPCVWYGPCLKELGIKPCQVQHERQEMLHPSLWATYTSSFPIQDSGMAVPFCTSSKTQSLRGLTGTHSLCSCMLVTSPSGTLPPCCEGPGNSRSLHRRELWGLGGQPC